MKKKGKRLLGILTSLAMMIGLMAGMSFTAYAGDAKAYADYDVTTETNKQEWRRPGGAAGAVQRPQLVHHQGRFHGVG